VTVARPFRIGVAVLLIAGAASASPPPATGRVIVELLNVRSEQGEVLVALFRDAREFPDTARAFARHAEKARAGSMRVVFDGVPPGSFAVTVLHDENGNRTMDTGMFGIPKEGYGFSRDAIGRLGPPDFAAAALTLGAGEDLPVPIHMRH
jgi:uncharacterized protein (DUF2141 family)